VYCDKTVSGWTCAYCPCPGNVGGYILHKTVNATKALCHVLKLRGNAVGTCKGIIPYAKKRAYKALYNANQIKIKDKQGRDAALRDEIVEFQDKLLSAHFPAVSGTSQRKRPRHEESDTGGGSSLGGRTLTTPPGTWTSSSSSSTVRIKQSFVPPNNPPNPKHQLKLCGNAILPEANQQMHIAITAFIHGSALPSTKAGTTNIRLGL
jgi:hypothetical protein